MTIHCSVQDGVAVLTLDAPPVNGLGLALRRALLDAFSQVSADPAVRVVVLTGAGRNFSAGADIREFGTPDALAAPNLRTLIDQVEASEKPVIAAIHGVCMGGGLELALACHYRIAQADAQIALPEVHLGLVPGAGGTQRLPRAIGLGPALERIVMGETIRADRLAAIPNQALFDRIVEDDLATATQTFAAKVAMRTGPQPRLRDREVETDDANSLLQATRKAIGPRGRDMPALLRCVDCVEAALILPFEKGLEFEATTFKALLLGPQSRALRHAFFAERGASRSPAVPRETTPREVRRIGIVGGGTMGSGIALSFLGAGYPVTMLEANQEALDRGVATVHGHLHNAARKGHIDLVQAEQRKARLYPALDEAALADVDLVVEAVFEDLAVKQRVFERLDAVLKPGAILASNTSTLDLDRIAAVTRRPQDVVGLHFFSPAQVMKLLEVVRGKATSAQVLATAMMVAKKLGKTAVVAGNCDGFIGNRMIEQTLRQALFLLEEGALPEQIDNAMEDFGFAMGPFRMSDLAGNDIGWAIRKRRAIDRPQMTYSKLADRLCELGRFGQKTSSGWYDYRPGERLARPSALVDRLIVSHSHALGIERRSIDSEEIVQRLVYALVNEGAQILDEKIASNAADIDAVYLCGYGFPRFRGGPMYYADQVGLPEVVRTMQRFAEADSAGRQAGAWTPAPLLRRLAEAGAKFHQLSPPNP